MGLVYLPTFTITIHVGKYTLRPMDRSWDTEATNYHRPFGVKISSQSPFGPSKSHIGFDGFDDGLFTSDSANNYVLVNVGSL